MVANAGRVNLVALAGEQCRDREQHSTEDEERSGCIEVTDYAPRVIRGDVEGHHVEQRSDIDGRQGERQDRCTANTETVGRIGQRDLVSSWRATNGALTAQPYWAAAENEIIAVSHLEISTCGLY
ncbi:MAG TPA: hypothetical protein VIP11_14455 [Gemmatimonadaceae bacterium]